MYPRTSKIYKFTNIALQETEKNIRFICYHLIFIASQDSKHSWKPLLNDGLF